MVQNEDKEVPGIPMSIRGIILISMILSLLVLVVLFEQGFLFIDPLGPFHIIDKSDSKLQNIGDYSTAIVTSVDQLASDLFTIEVGLFVLVGFVKQKVFSTDASLSVMEIVLFLGFIVVSFISFYLGYEARIQTLQLIDAVKLDFDVVEITLARQAFFTSVSAVLALALASFPFFPGDRPIDEKEYLENGAKRSAMGEASVRDRCIEEQQAEETSNDVASETLSSTPSGDTPSDGSAR